jgi:hypothetical protein
VERPRPGRRRRGEVLPRGGGPRARRAQRPRGDRR